MEKTCILLISADASLIHFWESNLKDIFPNEIHLYTLESQSDVRFFLKDKKKNGEDLFLVIKDKLSDKETEFFFQKSIWKIYPRAKGIQSSIIGDTSVIFRLLDQYSEYPLDKKRMDTKNSIAQKLQDLYQDWKRKASLTENTADIQACVELIACQWSAETHRIKDLLFSHGVRYEHFCPDTHPHTARKLESMQKNKSDLPLIILPDKSHLLKPTMKELAHALGWKLAPKRKNYDLVIAGAGPAGLGAAVYAASEGLQTLLIEKRAPGGQASQSAHIENYMGFPEGISGRELARRAVLQAQRLGAEIVAPQEIMHVAIEGRNKILSLSDGNEIRTKSMIIATGVNYKKLDIENENKFYGKGLYYASVLSETQACINQDVCILGGGNSAGQAALYLAKKAGKVYLVFRKKDLKESMSQYLIDRIENNPHIHCIPNMHVDELRGDSHLESIVLKDVRNSEKRIVPSTFLFVFIGARPCIEWFHPAIEKDEEGYIICGNNHRGGTHRKEQRLFMESSIPGIFAAGDIRSGSVKRVASAVGEGALAIKMLHSYLAEFF
jgi:thioredoxin reductase (NADPH)